MDCLDRHQITYQVESVEGMIGSRQSTVALTDLAGAIEHGARAGTLWAEVVLVVTAGGL